MVAYTFGEILRRVNFCATLFAAVPLAARGHNRGSISRIRLRGANAALALLVVLGPGVVATRSAQAQTFTVLHTFAGTPDGAFPYAGLVQDSAGNFYGTTTSGGGTGCYVGCGTVFKLDIAGNETVLYSFTGGSDGEQPYAGLVRDAAGNLYGAAAFGGDLSCFAPFGCGTVFKLDSTGTVTVLHSFTGGTDGSTPTASLVLDKAGNLYGTTAGGGVSPGNGNVFKLDNTGKETVLYSFTGGADGGIPRSNLVFLRSEDDDENENEDSVGNLYGTTRAGGDLNCANGAGCGTVFKVNAATGGEQVLYTFTGGVDGGQPYAGLEPDAAGNLYGTTYGIGTSPYGTVFKLNAANQETVLYGFKGQPDGSFPQAGLVRDAAGNLYGTTTAGGAFNAGTVFKLDSTGTVTVLHSFTGGTDGSTPTASLVRDKAGNLYGTTQVGGIHGSGVVFKLTP